MAFKLALNSMLNFFSLYSIMLEVKWLSVLQCQTAVIILIIFSKQ